MILLKQGEYKTITFTITDADGDVVDLSGALVTFDFEMKSLVSDTVALITKTTADFGTANAATGIITMSLNTDDTNQTPGGYIGELKIGAAATNIDKSHNIDIFIQEAVI